ncbi:peptidoglycan-binding protein [Mariprofundus ferrooxydans]|nr:peptidoglycan-binding protein [Mariprofundus ferrooxydans]
MMEILREGSTGSQVEELQTLLRQQGFDAGEVDGLFGEHTNQAVHEFQTKNGLPADGIVGQDTLAMFGHLEAESHQKFQQKGPDVMGFRKGKASSNKKPEIDIEVLESSPELNSETSEQHVTQYWLFQYKPDDEKTDWLESAKQGEAVPWHINRFQDEIQLGDVFFLWRAFKDEDERKHNRAASGLVGWGKISHLEFEDRGAATETPKKDIRLSLPVTWLEPMISRDVVIERIPKAEFQFLRSPQGTIFKVPEQVAAKLNNFINERGARVATPDLLSNATIISSDQPAEHDSFNRFAFAEYLARWLDRLWHEQLNASVKTGKEVKGDSFVLHLCGRWGAGKTTFMHQLDQCLHDDTKVTKPWIGIHFNAWRNQHVDPPWWGLLDRIISKGIEESREYPIWFRIKSLKRRFDRGDWKLEAGMAVLILVSVCIIGSEYFKGDVIKSLAAIFALGTAVFGFFSKVIPGFSASAQIFQRLSSDPMEKIRSYYYDIIETFDRPVIVFIDDLDRCKSAYVIELLESLHTLYSHPKVFFLVAADRTWISACFEEGYETFNGKIAQVEQPTGYRFLEKLFQLSIALPPISAELKALFMDEITSNGKSDAVVSFDEAYAAVEKEIQHVSSESELNDYMRSEPESAIHKQAMIAAAVIKAAKTESFATANKHRLTRFVDLMDANPRSMKLIVNAFGVYVNLARVSGVLDMDEPFLDQVALWTILEVRFPRVAEYLARFPDQVQIFAADAATEKEPGAHQVPDYLLALIGNESLKKIMGGCKLNNGDVIAPLTAKAIAVMVNGGSWKE